MNIYFIGIIFATSGIFFDICTLLVNEIQCTGLFTGQTWQDRVSSFQTALRLHPSFNYSLWYKQMEMACLASQNDKKIRQPASARLTN